MPAPEENCPGGPFGLIPDGPSAVCCDICDSKRLRGMSIMLTIATREAAKASDASSSLFQKRSPSSCIHASEGCSSASLSVPSITPTTSLSPVRPSLQCKLTVNQPGDRYEQEADRVAEVVMLTPDSAVRGPRPPIDLSTTYRSASFANFQPQTAFAPLQRAPARQDTARGAVAPASVSKVVSSQGQPLPADARTFMESRFGHDFSKVRIHTGSLAELSTREVSARAYTVGQHIAFAKGEFQPRSDSGRKLLAHELAHTVQQGGLVHRQSTEPEEDIDRQLVEGVSFVANPKGTDLFEMPDSSSRVLSRLADCQRVRRVTNEQFGGNWSKVIVEGILGSAKTGFVNDQVLKTPPPQTSLRIPDSNFIV